MGVKTNRLLKLGELQDDGLDCRPPIRVIRDELDNVIERIMTGSEAEDGLDKGRGQGLAYALAVLENPWVPSVPETMNRAMLRWEAAVEDREQQETEEAEENNEGE